MNDNLKVIFNSYENEKQKIRKRIDANKQTISKLNDEISAIYSGCVSFREKYEKGKENKQILADIDKKLAEAYETENILYTALKLANEMKVDAVGNALKNEIISNPEKWTKYPVHFKKFKDMIYDFLDRTGLYLCDSYGVGSYYITGSGDYHGFNAYVFNTSEGVITEKVIDEMKNKQEYPIIKASDILTEVKKAFTARKKILAKYESMKKEIDAIRAPFKSNTIYSILPYANSSPENYKRF